MPGVRGLVQVAEALSYFDHAAGRRREPVVSWDVIEVDPVIVAETDDEAEVERVRRMWMERVERNG